MSNDRLILHVDADAFFASVEQALHPELKSRAAIVGGGERGVVSAASYEARRFGVHSTMPIVQARKLCPQAVFLDPNFQAYSEFSRRMFSIMRKYSPLVEATSVDEGYADLTGTLRLHQALPWEVAHRLLCEIRSTLDINVSGGLLARTRTWAKMATGPGKTQWAPLPGAGGSRHHPRGPAREFCPWRREKSERNIGTGRDLHCGRPGWRTV